MGEPPCFANLLDAQGQMPDRPRVRIQRVYEAAAEDERATRVLVDRVWPRGMRKEELALDGWARELAPSDELRRWFGHDPNKWPEFQSRYRRELSGKEVELKALLQLARRGGLVLLYSTRDRDLNQAVVLRDVLEESL